MSADIRRRPNRAHGAIDNLPQGVQRQIADWYRGKPEDDIPRLTLDEISAKLKQLNYGVSRGQIWRWVSRQRDELDHLLDMAAGVEVSVIDAGLENLLVTVAVKALKGADMTQAASIQDLISLCDAVGRFRVSSTARDQWEQEKNKTIIEAVGRLKEKIGADHEMHPDLCRRLLESIDEAAKTMLERAA